NRIDFVLAAQETKKTALPTHPARRAEKTVDAAAGKTATSKTRAEHAAKKSVAKSASRAKTHKSRKQ
ncbi:MAG: hypothetical protein LBS89_06265, partial [Zoogloeaceae bacterium]|nr:hypothetical protein [Zoogloeaceae bacterium]